MPKLRTTKYVVTKMSQKFHFRRLFSKQHGERSQTLFKSSQQQFSHIYWSVCRIFSSKKSPLVICKILGLFANSLTADDKYTLLNRVNLMQPIQMELSKKQKLFWELSSAFLKSRSIFKHSQTKKSPSELMYFRNYGLQIKWLDKCLTIPASEDSSANNMVNGRKHCWNLPDSTFIVFIDYCEENVGGPSLS